MGSETMLDRRADSRDRVMLGGLVATDAASSQVECIVRNISASGANIELPSTATVPESIKLAIGKTGRSFLARIVWWRANRAGLAFDTPRDNSHSPHGLDLEERLRISEKKARALKRRVRELLGEG